MSAHKVCQLLTKLYPNRTKTVQAPTYRIYGPSFYIISQSVRYIIQTQIQSLSDNNMLVCQK